MIASLRGLLLLPLLLPACLVAVAGELDDRLAAREQAAKLYRDGDFVGLEAIAHDYRQTGVRTASGSWKLPLFYEGIADHALGFSKEQDAEWQLAFARLDDWIRQFPGSPTPYIAKASALMSRGREYRGVSWASGVDPSDMQAYHDFALQAAEVLGENGEVASTDPHWYVAVGSVYQALGGNKDEFLALVSEGLERFPDFDPLMFKAAGFMSEKWYGSDAELDAFIQQLVERTKETRGYELYARLYWAAGMRSRSEYAFQSPNANWYYMVEGMDDVLERYPDQWNIQHFAWFSCYAGDLKTALRYLDMVNPPIITNAWSSERNYRACRTRAETLKSLQQEVDAAGHGQGG